MSLIHFITNVTRLNSIPVEELIDIEKNCIDPLRSFWHQYNYLTPNWWLLVIFSIVPPVIWWKLVDKKRIIEITAFGLFYGVAAIILDAIGSNLILWIYPYRLTPYLHPQLYPFDVAIVIIPFMLLYQRWYIDFKKFLLVTGLLSAFLAFIGEPFLEWLNIYQEITWKNIYSFPIYWLIAIICWGIIKFFKKLEQRNSHDLERRKRIDK